MPVDKSDPVQLTLDLMRIDSTSGREGDVISFAESVLAARGWNVRRIPVSAGRDDLLASSGANPRVTFSTHLDTVPPYIAPRLEKEVIHGRGACDAKGIAAAMICAAEKLRDSGEAVSLLFVVGEEVSHDGAHAANAIANSSRILINGEPTESKLGTGTKGAVRLILRTKGIPAHSAYPELGRSATVELSRLLVEMQGLKLPRHELFGETTINVGMISGGVADNVVAPFAEARLMARLVGPVEDLIAQLTKWLDGRAELESSVTVPTVKLGTVDGFDTSVVAFATDIPVLTNWGTPYLFGPGSIHVAHRDDEHIRISELKAAVDAYEKLARRALDQL